MNEKWILYRNRIFFDSSADTFAAAAEAARRELEAEQDFRMLAELAIDLQSYLVSYVEGCTPSLRETARIQSEAIIADLRGRGEDELLRYVSEELDVLKNSSLIQLTELADQKKLAVRWGNDNGLGLMNAMHCTGNGKLILQQYSDDQLNKLIAAKGLTRYTDHTITTKEALLDELEKIRKRGYAIDNEECEIGARCVACPICDYTGNIIAGVSITGPSTRITMNTGATRKPQVPQTHITMM